MAIPPAFCESEVQEQESQGPWEVQEDADQEQQLAQADIPYGGVGGLRAAGAATPLAAAEPGGAASAAAAATETYADAKEPGCG